jgi:cellulose synthase/poly-beta-1,6-N-acetylglucosamine synthase-like glycosyltransferase
MNLKTSAACLNDNITAMAQQKCSIVIPVVPKHFRYLKKLLDELFSENGFIGEIHICASSVDETRLLKLMQIVSQSSFNKIIKVHSCLETRTAGENRNHGWDNSIFDIVVFLDADDLYHPNRLQFLTNLMISNHADAIVHDYYRMAPKFFFKFVNIKSHLLISAEQLYKTNEFELESSLPSGSLYGGESNLLLPAETFKNSKVHHGHLTVRRDVQIRYTNRKLGEDGELVREILKRGYKMVYVSAKLSIYDRFNFSNYFLSMKGHASVQLSRIYRLFFPKANKRINE